jgi:hypothetical protein
LTGSGSWSSPQGFRPVTGALLHAIARPSKFLLRTSRRSGVPTSIRNRRQKEDRPEPRAEGSEEQGAAQQEGKSQEAQTAINKTEPAPTASQAEANPLTAEKPALPNAPQQPMSIPMHFGTREK